MKELRTMWPFPSSKTRRAPTRRRPARLHLWLEALEDRCLLNAGALDTTFGSGGVVKTTLPGGSYARGVALQPNGQLVQSGYTVASNGYTEFALVRYNANGTLDPAFGSGGTVVTQI